MKYFVFPAADKPTWDTLNDQGGGVRLVDYLHNPNTAEYAAEIPENHLPSIAERAGDSASTIQAGLVDTLPGFLDPSEDPYNEDGSLKSTMGDWVRV